MPIKPPTVKYYSSTYILTYPILIAQNIKINDAKYFPHIFNGVSYEYLHKPFQNLYVKINNNHIKFNRAFEP